MESDDNRNAGVAATSAIERHASLREAITSEEPNLRRGVEALVWKRGLAAGRDAVVVVADDVLQETFARALRRADTFDPARSAHAWLFGIAINVVREQQRVLRAERDYTVQGVPGMDEMTDNLTTASEAALARLHDVESEKAYRVIELLDLVPPPEREVLRHRYVDNLRGPELAAALGGISEGAARVRVSRARAHLSRAYAESERGQSHDGEGQ